MYDRLQIEIEGNEITIEFHKFEKSENLKEINQDFFRAYAYYRLKYFEADHSDKEKALELVKDQLKNFIEEEKDRYSKDKVHTLYNYFKSFSIITVCLIILMLLLHASEVDLSRLNTDLIYTMIASLSAVSIALWIYWKQQSDRFKMLKESLRIYLDYIIFNLPKSKVISEKAFLEEFHKRKKEGRLTSDYVIKSGEPIELTPVAWGRMSYVSDNLIDDLITSGYFHVIFKELMSLKNYIKSYNERRNILNEFDSFLSDTSNDDKDYLLKQHFIVSRTNHSVESIKITIEEIQNKLYE